MVDIYRTWVEDFDIDGFRIDTMKHVNDEFWQKFGPSHAGDRRRPTATRTSSCSARSRSTAATRRPRASPRTTRPTTGCRRSSTSRSRTPPAASRRRALDNQRARAVLRQRRLVHRPRLQRLLAADVPRQPRHGPDRASSSRPTTPGRTTPSCSPATGWPTSSCTSRGATRSSTTATSRASPARRRPARPADDVRQPGAGVPGRRPDRLRPDAGAEDDFVTDSPMYQAIQRLARAHRRPAGAAQRRRAGALRLARARASSRSPGSTARRQKEYVVALNNSESAASADDADVHPQGPLPQGVRRRAAPPDDATATAPSTSSLPGLSTAVYMSDDRIPRSHAAPQIGLDRAGAGGGVARPDARRGERARRLVLRGDLPAQGRPRGLADDRGRRLGALPGLRRRLAAAGRGARWPTARPCWTTPATGAGSAARSTTVPRTQVTVSARPPTAARSAASTRSPDRGRGPRAARCSRSSSSAAWPAGPGPASARTAPRRRTPVTDDVSAPAAGHVGPLPRDPQRARQSCRTRARPWPVTTALPQPAVGSVTVAGSLQSELGVPGRLAARLRGHPPRLRHPRREVARHLHAAGRRLRVEGRDRRLVGRQLRRRRRGGRQQPAPSPCPAGGGSYVFTWDQVTHVPSAAPAA